MKRRKTEPAHIPSATYRLQFNRSFTFEQAAALVPYLDELGITDVYASPFLMARPGSLHGYDVTDHTRFNPEIGDEKSFLHFSEELKRRGMSLIADVVPNHMCISHPSNVWWWDVLENGPGSHYAPYFDIDWHPPKQELANKVLLPVLGDQYGRVLENREIKVIYESGALQVVYYDTPLPLAPRTWTAMLEPAVVRLRESLGPADDRVLELESIVTALHHLPAPDETDETKVQERQREKEVVKRRLAALVDGSQPVRQAIDASLEDINGKQGDPRSFDRLEKLLESEPYRLSFWRVAVDEINYRRFFDINELAAIRVEDPEVFSAVHAFLFDLVSRGHISGLRVDHPDGLFDPEKYFRYLQDACKAVQGAPDKAAGRSRRATADRTFYIVAEKILTGSEPLRTTWPIEGTTGYEFMNLVNGVFVDRSKKKAFQQLYRRFTGWPFEFADLVYYCKRLILNVSMSSELNVLARRLDHISEQHRWYRDFTLENLRDALRDVLASFPVYRTYLRSDLSEVDQEDRRQIHAAIREAKRRNPAINESVFDFIQSVLLEEHPDGLDDAQRAERHLFSMRFQQLTGPVMAKGVEDTAFYRFYPLASLNEVGGDPERFGVSATAFHRRNLIRRELWPNSMTATTTHDTQRSEDVRSRINVLSEKPADWYRAIRRWQEMNRKWKTKVGNRAAPTAVDEYLFYQTLIGTWPFETMGADAHAAYVERIQSYMEKALREAKVHTSWISPNAEYEAAARRFVESALEFEDNPFLEDFRRFQAPVARAGIWNSISQTLLKVASPGAPDFYQGSELWSFQLVDPDNRGAVDYDLRRAMLKKLCVSRECDSSGLVARLMNSAEDGAIKLYVTTRALRFRRDHRDLFAHGSYVALAAAGARADHVVAFARTLAGHTVIAAAGRFFLKLCNSHGSPHGEAAWGNTTLLMPRRLAPGGFRDLFTGQTIAAEPRNGKVALPLAKLFAHCPVALLSGIHESATQD